MIIRCSAIPPEVYGQAAEPILRRPDLPNTRRRPEADLLRPGGTERQVLGVCSRGLPGWWPSPGRFGPGSTGRVACRARPDPAGVPGVLRGPGDLWPPVLLGVSGELVGEEGEAVTDDSGVDEAHGLDAADLAEEALAGPEHDREDDQPQLVGEVVLDERATELTAGGDDDFSVELLLQFRDLGHDVAVQDR